MILSELIPFLKRLDAHPKKRLSQNFLIDPNIAKKIVQIAEIHPGDKVLEIGPGAGALTASLLAAGAQVYAVELDAVLAQELHRFQNLSIFQDDFLQFPLEKLPSPLKVVANLPYHITTPILEKLCNSHSQFTSLTLMVQKEVADRMTASPGSKEFSSLALFLQFYTRLHRPLKVPASCFYPRPKVDSAVVRLDVQTPPPIDPAPFFALVRQAFQQRRKMISTSLRNPAIKKVLGAIGENPDARPEDLSLEKWLRLYEIVGINEPAR